MFKCILLLILFSTSAFGYELVIIQGVSKEKQSFVTRGGKDKGIFEGRNATFTSDNISVIAVALEVSREFTQWEIKNDFTNLPFEKGEMVVMYDTTEYLWALSPAEVQRRQVKTRLFNVKKSMEVHTSFSKGLSESVSEAIAQSTDRSGYQIDGMFRRELDRNYAFALGFRYVKETVNTITTTFINQQFLGTIEGRYYFDPIPDFYNAQVGLTLGMGYGQSRTTSVGQTSFGNAILLPSTRISFSIPVDQEYDIEFMGAFESVRLEESFASGSEQTTNIINSKAGVIFRKHLK